ncbi:hypothetical protein HII36_30365 [Nonomuraea sp. NN258]|uniref:hypothetical protein n=1 Tax=Nonomuraea antri TaxID=2730852 RepID=UPI0015685862|nr:hypothetical protein [Nonomuraea antri]NRQ36106.1 hypothetical protein [Nonomuraea antri]
MWLWLSPEDQLIIRTIGSPGEAPNEVVTRALRLLWHQQAHAAAETGPAPAAGEPAHPLVAEMARLRAQGINPGRLRDQPRS